MFEAVKDIARCGGFRRSRTLALKHDVDLEWPRRRSQTFETYQMPMNSPTEQCTGMYLKRLLVAALKKSMN